MTARLTRRCWQSISITSQTDPVVLRGFLFICISPGYISFMLSFAATGPTTDIGFLALDLKESMESPGRGISREVQRSAGRITVPLEGTWN